MGVVHLVLLQQHQHLAVLQHHSWSTVWNSCFHPSVHGSANIIALVSTFHFLLFLDTSILDSQERVWSFFQDRPSQGNPTRTDRATNKCQDFLSLVLVILSHLFFSLFILICWTARSMERSRFFLLKKSYLRPRWPKPPHFFFLL